MAQDKSTEQPNNLGINSRFSGNAENYGVATTFDDKKYNVDSMQYPDDLLQEQNNPYGGNFVIFYINVNEDSKLLKDRSADRRAVETVRDGTERERGFAVGQSVSKTEAIAAGTVVGSATGAGASALNVFKTSPKTVGAAVGFAAASSIGSSTSTFTRKQRRMKSCIALHVPPEMNIKYGVQWVEEDTAIAAAVTAGISESGNAISKFLKSATAPANSIRERFSNIVNSSGDTLGGSADLAKSSITNLALKVGPGADYVSALTGMAANPKKEQLFKGVDYRTFNFTYQFFPKDAAEAQSIREIIKTFKLHMHPEFKDAYNMIYLYPSEFDIFYYQNGKENMNLHRHTSCVLTDMNINYAPQGVFSAFDDGMPTQITVTLTFKELALLTKDHIEDGY